MAAQLGCTGCVSQGHLGFAGLSRQQRQSSNAQSECHCAERRPPPATLKYSRILRHYQETRLDEQGGGRHNVEEKGRDGLNSHCDIYVCFV